MSYSTKVETSNGDALFLGVQPTLLQKACARDLLALGAKINAGLEELKKSLPQGFTVYFAGVNSLIIKEGRKGEDINEP